VTLFKTADAEKVVSAASLAEPESENGSVLEELSEDGDAELEAVSEDDQGLDENSSEGTDDE
jgi:hypothetical protein